MSSVLKVNQIQDIGGNTIVSSDGTGGFTNNLPAGKSGAYRNLIINGDMSIAQRGTSVSSITSSGYYTVDRWEFQVGSMGTWTMSQDTDVPTGQGFAKSTKLDCTTADAAPASGDSLRIAQKFEGQNLQYLKKGTANAVSLTLSFWVKSVKTGTYIVELRDVDNSRLIAKSYTINSASTWEKKTITFAGDTTGTLDNDNAKSLECNFWLGAGTTFTSGTLATSWESLTQANRAVGQVNLADNTANNFWITGVQLEAGTTASDFEFLPYDVNLQRCYRYYELITTGETNKSIGLALYYNNTTLYTQIPTTKTMRTVPSLDQVSATNYYGFLRAGALDTFDDFTISGRSTNRIVEMQNNTDVSGSGGQAGFMITNNASAYIAFEAEL